MNRAWCASALPSRKPPSPPRSTGWRGSRTPRAMLRTNLRPSPSRAAARACVARPISSHPQRGRASGRTRSRDIRLGIVGHALRGRPGVDCLHIAFPVHAGVEQKIAAVDGLRRHAHQRQAHKTRCIGDTEALAAQIRPELRDPLEAGNVMREQLLDAPLGRVSHGATEECFLVEIARGQFEMHIHEHDQFALLSRFPRISGENRLVGKTRGQILDDALRFAQIAVFGLDIGHLAERRMLEHRLFLARQHEHFLERNTVFEEHELHLVVIVRERETAQLDHRVSPFFGLFETASQNQRGGLRSIIQQIARSCYSKITMESRITMTSRNFSIETIGIVGTGAMGRGIAQIAALAGLTVRLYDTNPAAIGAARDYLAETFAKLTAKGKLDQARSLVALANVSGAQVVGDLADCDLVVEAIVEKLDVKQALFRELETVVSGRCVLASNTSSLSITAIAAGCTDPSRVAGYHFFNPVPLMKVVEVIDGLRSDPAVGDALMELARRMGHTPVRAKDMPGLIVNHAGRGMNTEGLRVASAGVASFADIDRIMREQAGFRLGPFELLDLTALDVSHPVMESIYHQFSEEPRFTPPPITGTRLAGGLIGRRTGAGFYRYEDGKQQVPAEAPAPTELPA